MEKTDPSQRIASVQILSPRLKHWTKTNLQTSCQNSATEARASSKSRLSQFVPNRYVLDIMAPAKDL